MKRCLVNIPILYPSLETPEIMCDVSQLSGFCILEMLALIFTGLTDSLFTPLHVDVCLVSTKRLYLLR